MAAPRLSLRQRGRLSLPRLLTAARLPLLLAFSLCALAWCVAILAQRMGWRALSDHHYLLVESGLPWPVAAVVFLAAWQVMLLAMMAPASAPQVVRALERESRVVPAAPAGRALAAAALAFAAVWTAFGLAAFSGDTGIHHLVDALPWLAAHSFVIGATTLALAGACQFTPWKAACLARCRDPRALFSRGALARPCGVWRQGLAYGAASLGSCWALMLIMFGIGVGGLGWMLALTGAMLAETYAPGQVGQASARRLIGVALLALAALWLAHPAWLVPATAA